MKDLRRRLLAGLALGFIVILALTLLGDVREVRAHLAEFKWALTPLILLGTLFNYTLRFFKWHFFLGQIGIRDLAWLRSLQLFVAGFPLAVTPGKVGEALKGVWLNRECGTPVARGVTVVLAERVSDGLAVLLLSSLGVLAYPRYWPAFASVLGLLLIGVVLSQIRPAALRILALLGRLPLINKFQHHLLEFYEGAYSLFRPRSTVISVGLGTAAWFGEGVAMYLVLLGLGVPPGGEILGLAVFVLAFSTVIGAVSALPGGLGAAELSIAGMLALTLGLEASTAAAATLLIRLGTLWFGVTLGLIVWLFSRDLLLLESSDPTQSPESLPT
ncbi:MAG: lysylphosphatidylglycerol synthase transmembrane domain-containing protein [Anaerolineales bacterium]|nr:lysylphosphatidylglycerol synthase transmembrane domain-containing protein [Anaerolineales bacterium]